MRMSLRACMHAGRSVLGLLLSGLADSDSENEEGKNKKKEEEKAPEFPQPPAIYTCASAFMSAMEQVRQGRTTLPGCTAPVVHAAVDGQLEVMLLPLGYDAQTIAWGFDLTVRLMHHRNMACVVAALAPMRAHKLYARFLPTSSTPVNNFHSHETEIALIQLLVWLLILVDMTSGHVSSQGQELTSTLFPTPYEQRTAISLRLRAVLKAQFCLEGVDTRAIQAWVLQVMERVWPMPPTACATDHGTAPWDLCCRMDPNAILQALRRAASTRPSESHNKEDQTGMPEADAAGIVEDAAEQAVPALHAPANALAPNAPQLQLLLPGNAALHSTLVEKMMDDVAAQVLANILTREQQAAKARVVAAWFLPMSANAAGAARHRPNGLPSSPTAEKLQHQLMSLPAASDLLVHTAQLVGEPAPAAPSLAETEGAQGLTTAADVQSTQGLNTAADMQLQRTEGLVPSSEQDDISMQPRSDSSELLDGVSVAMQDSSLELSSDGMMSASPLQRPSFRVTSPPPLQPHSDSMLSDSPSEQMELSSSLDMVLPPSSSQMAVTLVHGGSAAAALMGTRVPRRVVSMGGSLPISHSATQVARSNRHGVRSMGGAISVVAVNKQLEGKQDAFASEARSLCPRASTPASMETGILAIYTRTIPILEATTDTDVIVIMDVATGKRDVKANVNKPDMQTSERRRLQALGVCEQPLATGTQVVPFRRAHSVQLMGSDMSAPLGVARSQTGPITDLPKLASPLQQQQQQHVRTSAAATGPPADQQQQQQQQQQGLLPEMVSSGDQTCEAGLHQAKAAAVPAAKKKGALRKLRKGAQAACKGLREALSQVRSFCAQAGTELKSMLLCHGPAPFQ